MNPIESILKHILYCVTGNSQQSEQASKMTKKIPPIANDAEIKLNIFIPTVIRPYPHQHEGEFYRCHSIEQTPVIFSCRGNEITIQCDAITFRRILQSSPESLQTINVISDNTDDRIFKNAEIADENGCFELLADKITIITEALIFNSFATRINLDHNLIDNIATKDIAEALTSPNCILRSLTLSNNEIDDDGATILASGIINNNTLEHLDLSFNYITNDGAIALASAIEYPNCHLQTIDLTDNGISIEGAKALARAVINSGRDIHVIGVDQWEELKKAIIIENEADISVSQFSTKVALLTSSFLTNPILSQSKCGFFPIPSEVTCRRASHPCDDEGVDEFSDASHKRMHYD